MWLFNTVGQPVDSVTFGFQVADKSIGRTASGWSLLGSATPGVNNSAAVAPGSASGLRINEWMASPVNGNDWFEIYNGATQPVSLAGLFLSDNPSTQGLTQFKIAPLSFIGARGFVKLVADASGQPHRLSPGQSLWPRLA